MTAPPSNFSNGNGNGNGNGHNGSNGVAHYEEAPPAVMQRFVRMLRRRWLVVLLAFVAIPSVTMAITLNKQKEYTATSTLLMQDTGTQTLFGNTPVLPPSTDQEREAATNADLATLNTVAANTAKTLGRGVTAGVVAGSVKVISSSSSNVVRVQATNHDPDLARRIADAYGQQFVAFRANSDKTKIAGFQKDLDSQLGDVQRRISSIKGQLVVAGPQQAALLKADMRQARQDRSDILQRISQLRSTAALESGGLDFVQHAQTPGSPSSPKPVKSGILGAGLGLVLGLALAGLFEALDRRVKEPKDVEEIFNRPIVGAIPESPALAGADPRDLGAGEKEAFRMMRATLQYFNVDRPMKSILVTSGAPGDGKTTIAWHLAAAAASAGSRVLLIEAELRKPSFVRRFNMESTAGLTDVLALGAQPGDVIFELPIGEGKKGTEQASTVDVLPAGPVPPNPSDLIESPRMAAVIEQATRHYDLVVIDAPPAAVVSDAIPLVKRVDGVLVVVRLNKSTRDGTQHLHDRLSHLDADVLGVVLNGISGSDGYYGVAYGYGAEYKTGASAIR